MGIAYNTSVVRSGLVLALDAANVKSYPGSGTVWADLSGQGNTSTVLGEATYSSANQGVFTLDGVDDRFNCGNAAAINFGTGDFTVSLWFRRFANATTNLRLLSKAAGGDGVTAADAGFCFFGGNTNLEFAVNPTAPRSFVTAGTFALNEWVCVTGLLERGVSMRAYKNALLTGTTAAPVGSVSGTTSLFIGDNVGANLRWAGEIAQVLLYNRALTQAEIAQNFEALRGRFGI